MAYFKVDPESPTGLKIKEIFERSDAVRDRRIAFMKKVGAESGRSNNRTLEGISGVVFDEGVEVDGETPVVRIFVVHIDEPDSTPVVTDKRVGRHLEGSRAVGYDGLAHHLGTVPVLAGRIVFDESDATVTDIGFCLGIQVSNHLTVGQSQHVDAAVSGLLGIRRIGIGIGFVPTGDNGSGHHIAGAGILLSYLLPHIGNGRL